MTFTALVSAVNSQSQQAAEFFAEPTNLKVLPADISKSRLKRIMSGFESDLGVSCGYCHVEDRDTGIIDYASDENTRKHTARLMITMVEAINGEYLAKLGGDRRYAVPVTCGSCHRGRSNPQAFEGH